MASVRNLRRGSFWRWCGQLILLGATLGISSPYLHAGAWNQAPGHGQIILSSSFLETRRGFDASGSEQPFGSQGRFRQIAFNPYVEIGLTRRNTLVLNLNAPVLLYSDRYGSSTSGGLGDVEIGLKRRLNATESKWAISGQLTAKFPGYPAQRNPAPGNHQEDAEARFLIGRGGLLAGHHFFWDAEAAYRYRSLAPADQFRADFSTGLNLSRRWMAMGQVFAIQSLRNGDPFSTTNPSAQSDFDLYKTEFSLVTLIRRNTRVQIGWCDAFAGRNTGSGHSFLIGLWKNF